MILVTGATGCVGAHVVRGLVERGDRVRLLVLPAEDPAAVPSLSDLVAHVEVVRGDVRDASTIDAAVRGCAAVMHLAGVVGLTTALADRMRDVNVAGARTVAEASLRHGARLVLTSSASAVGLPPDGVVADEDFDFSSTPVTHPYPLTKHAGEQAVLKLVSEGLDAVVLNPGAVLAPGGDWRSTWSGLVRRVADGGFPLAPPGGFAFVGRRDVVEAHLAALDRGRTGRRYLVVAENLPLADLIGLVADALGARRPRATAPAWAVRAIAVASLPVAAVRDPSRSPLIVPANLPFLVRDLRYDGGRARRELGLAPRPVAEAVRELVAWCRETGLVHASTPRPDRYPAIRRTT